MQLLSVARAVCLQNANAPESLVSLSHSQEVTVELLVPLPAQPFVEAPRGMVVGGSFQHQSVSLGGLGKQPRSLCECMANPFLASDWTSRKGR